MKLRSNRRLKVDTVSVKQWRPCRRQSCFIVTDLALNFYARNVTRAACCDSSIENHYVM